MNNEWLITDTHFDHDNIGVYCDRPAGWAERVINNWRRMVKATDLIIHLGDVRVGRGDLLDLMNSLPGVKVLVMGNHDTKSPLWYTRNGFAIAVDAMAYKGVTLTHRPAAELIVGTDINVHGHCHNSEWKPQKDFHRLLALEHEDYRPVNFFKWTGMARSLQKWAAHTAHWTMIPNIERRKNSGTP